VQPATFEAAPNPSRRDDEDRDPPDRGKKKGKDHD